MNSEIAFDLVVSISGVFMCLLYYHVWRMHDNVREEKLTLAFFLMDFIPFKPVLTDKGKYHRRRAGWYLICLAICFAIAFFIDRYRRGLILGGP